MKTIFHNLNSIVIVSHNVLHIVSRNGTAILRSPNIHKLHEKLIGSDNAESTRESLVVDDESDPKDEIQQYLRAMTEAGAFLSAPTRAGTTERPGNATVSLHPIVPAAAVPCRFTLADGREALVSLNGRISAEIEQPDICVVFAGAEFIWRDLIGSGLPGGRSPAVLYYVIVSSGPAPEEISAAELQRRASYAGWLLLNAENIRKRPSRMIRIYRPDAIRGSLTRILNFTYSRPGDFVHLPESMEMITAIGYQLPLAVARVGHSLAPNSVVGFGLRQDHDLHEQLIHDILAQSILSSPDRDKHNRRSFEKAMGERCRTSAREISDADLRLPGCFVTSSLLHLRIRLLEHCAYLAQTPATEQSTDLLKEDSSHPHILYLSEILRVRRPSLPATFRQSLEGLFIYEVEGACSCSFIRAKALRDTLLNAAAVAFYETGASDPGTSALHSDFATFASRAALRSLAKHHEAQLAIRCPEYTLFFQKVSGWGRNIWIGRAARNRHE